MRTKTILLSAIVGAASCASMMGQVFSLNAVGYVNVTCKPGFTIIANQLNTTNNTIAALIPVDPAGTMDGDTVFKYNNGYTTITMNSGNLPATPWDGPATTTTLNPGEAVFFQNVYNAPITLTFVGTVLQGGLTNALPHGFSLVSSLVPQAGGLTSSLGLAVDPSGSQDGDTVFVYSNPGGYSSFGANSGNLPATPWDPSEPTVAVGQGFFYDHTGNAQPVQWVRNFTVN